MAAGVIPAPGTEYGPCATPCAHRDCGRSRKDAALPCRICKEPIGYSTRYYQENDDANGYALVHAACAEDEAERGRR
jgi:hypothetical protein